MVLIETTTGKTLPMPESWDEVTLELAERINLVLDATKGMEPIDVALAFIGELLNLNYVDVASTLTTAGFEKACEVAAFAQKPPEIKPVHEFEFGGVKWHIPNPKPTVWQRFKAKPKLDAEPFGKWMLLDAYRLFHPKAMQDVAANKPDAVARLIAVLVHEKDNYDMPAALEAEVERRRELFKGLPYPIAAGVVLFFCQKLSVLPKAHLINGFSQ